MMKNLDKQKENGLMNMKMKASQMFKTTKLYILKFLAIVHLRKLKWYEYCGYVTLKEYNEALMERITAVSNYIAHEEKRGKSFEIVPPGFYPKTNSMVIVPPGILVPNF